MELGQRIDRLEDRDALGLVVVRLRERCGDGRSTEGEGKTSRQTGRLRDGHHQAAVQTVSHMPGPERKKYEGCHLDQADIAQNHSGAGLGVQIPTGRDRHHLQAEVRKEGAGEQETVVAESE